MTIEINLVVVAIIFSIIAIMAIIGYLVEGSNVDNKKKDKKKEQKEEKVNEVTIEEDMPAPSAWTGDIKVEDPTHQQVHTVSTVDDWSMMPQVEPSLEEQKTDEITPVEDNGVTFEEPLNNPVEKAEPLNVSSESIQIPSVFEMPAEPVIGTSLQQPIEPLTSVVEESIKMPEAGPEINVKAENLEIDNQENQTNNSVWK
ncbi:MAG: hypothetical protein HFH46_00280 [Bacilli bacterium]|nr:hypothetical protein [Bacilli bacterium]